jgi:ABC-type polysaccharide/polyol phosphate export permease
MQGPIVHTEYDKAIGDIIDGVSSWRLWGRLGWQDVKRRYRRTLIGPFWTTLSLAIFMLSLGFVWAALWKQDPKTYLPFLAAGLIPWTLFASVISEGSGTYAANSSIITQLRFPYSALVCTVVWRNLIVFFHNLLIYVPIALYGGIPVNENTLLVVPGLLLFAINGIWISTLLSLACTRYRDFTPLVTSMLQISMFVTPIFWNPSQLGGEASRLVQYNIIYHYIDAIRAPLLGKAPSLVTWEAIFIATVVGWTTTLILYSRFRRRIAYWI